MLPERIVCLTEEPTEVLYALGEEHRIVGISGFTVRPARARREKPKVSAFTSADLPAILALRPDLVIGFSDIQAEIARDLIRAGVEVWISNHRTVAGILGYVRRLGAMVGAVERADRHAESLAAHVAKVQREAQSLPVRPRVYFEEWDDPMITAIGWVAELVRIAGGHDVFPDRSLPLAKDRIVRDASEVVAAAPDLILASWCGKKVRADAIAARPGFGGLCAVQRGAIVEIDSSIILQPGPAALTDGLDALAAAIRAVANELAAG
jgi:iron complex transport system substrate-binding protein